GSGFDGSTRAVGQDYAKALALARNAGDPAPPSDGFIKTVHIDLHRGRKMRPIVVVALGLWIGVIPAASQNIPKSLQEGGPEEIIRQRQNNWTVGVAGGNMDGTYLRFADEIGKVLDDGDELRVLPTISRGAAGNLQDLIYLRGIDVAFTQSDVF